MKFIYTFLIIVIPFLSASQSNTDDSPFRQLYDLLPTANNYRNLQVRQVMNIINSEPTTI